MMAGQTISDRILAARHSIAGQGLAKAVCKATTEGIVCPKKKHLDYLVHCTNEPNVSIPQMATLLVERTQNANWVVVFKALITTHHLMSYGNERFTQYMASSNSTFQLGTFLDKSGVQGGGLSAIPGLNLNKTGYDMSPYIRRYSNYINEKAIAYRTVAFDFCKIKRGKTEGAIRKLSTDSLLKTIPALQNQLDALLEFECNVTDLTNGVIIGAFMLLFRDLIRLFACYNDAIICLLEKYFDMTKKQCKDAIDIYKKFLTRMDRVTEFLRVSENVGIDRSEIPDLTKAPSSLLDALEQHLHGLEGKRAGSGASGSNASTPNGSAQTNFKNGVSALSSTSTSFGSAAKFGAESAEPLEIDESLRRKILAEEEAAMNQYKSKVQSMESPMSTHSSSSNATANNPFLDYGGNFGSEREFFGSMGSGATTSRASDDLLQLGNPFDPFVANGGANNGTWGTTTNMNAFFTAPTEFVSDVNFSSVFGTNEASSQMGNDKLNGKSTSTTNQASGLLTGDLDSSLASLCENLTINKTPLQPKEVNWNSPKSAGKSNWTHASNSTTADATYRPMGQGMSSIPAIKPAPFVAQAQFQTLQPNAQQSFIFPMMQPYGQMNAGQMQSSLFSNQSNNSLFN